MSESLVSGVGNPEEKLPIIDQSQIERAMIQFWDNGPSVKQRYKVKVRLNLIDKTNPQFIAPVTKDWGNFKKYIPQESREETLDAVRGWRKEVKEHYGVYPYIGKFHLQNPDKHIQVEPHTWAGVYYSQIAEHWKCVVKMYDWVYQCDFETDYITTAQKLKGLHAQHLYINPEHDKRVRPLTYAEQRRLKE
jgi:hypothetical protein